MSNGNSSSQGSLQDPPTYKLKPSLSTGSFKSIRSPNSPTGTSWEEPLGEKSFRDQGTFVPPQGTGRAHHFFNEAKRERSKSVIEKPPPHLVGDQSPYSGYHHSAYDPLCPNPVTGYTDLTPRAPRPVSGMALNHNKYNEQQKYVYCPKCLAYCPLPNHYYVPLDCWYCSQKMKAYV